jgi:hypothetical protein
MKLMHGFTLFALLAAALCWSGLTAQANAQSAAAKTIQEAATRFENNVMAMAQAMPADKYSFAPSPETFKAGSPAQFATVRTFAQQLTHLSALPFRLLAPFGVKADADYKAYDSLTSKDDIVKALQASFDYENKVIATITPENAFTPEGPRGATRVGAMLMMLNDDGDHYGQMVEYLRMNGIIPPATERQMHHAGAPHM